MKKLVQIKVTVEPPYREFRFDDEEWLEANYRGYEVYERPSIFKNAAVNEVEENFLKYFGAVMVEHDLTKALRIKEGGISKENLKPAFLITIGIRKIEVKAGKKVESLKKVQYFIIYRKGQNAVILPLINKTFTNWDETLKIFAGFREKYMKKGFDSFVSNIVIVREIPLREVQLKKK